LNCSESQSKQLELLTQILDFVKQTSGLRRRASQEGLLEIWQVSDGKFIAIRPEDLDEVLFRSDTDGRDFIQVNFRKGTKILLTNTLIGFKPAPLIGLDTSKLPKVVTTPDIMSIFEAIQETMHASETTDEEVIVLKKVFEAVIAGGELVGFDLATEKVWLTRLPAQFLKVTA
jgi:hypothetical protein